MCGTRLIFTVSAHVYEQDALPDSVGKPVVVVLWGVGKPPPGHVAFGGSSEPGTHLGPGHRLGLNPYLSFPKIDLRASQPNRRRLTSFQVF